MPHEIPISPQDIILGFFEYFDIDFIEYSQMIQLCLESGCPNKKVADMLLLSLVESDKLFPSKDASGRMYLSNKAPTNPPIH